MLPLLARKYVYRYLILAIALPIVARLCLYGARKIERRAGSNTKAAGALRRVGSFARRRSDRGRHRESVR